MGRLAGWGVDTLFGLPGDGVNGIMEASRRHQDRVRFVLVHHEEASAFMATAYAKATGRPRGLAAVHGSPQACGGVLALQRDRPDRGMSLADPGGRLPHEARGLRLTDGAGAAGWYGAGR